jgi:hypothetical protein
MKKNTPEASDFLKEMGDIGQDIVAQRPALDAEAGAYMSEADRILAQPSLAAANAAFDQYLADHRSLRGEPEWYKVLGMRSVRGIARELMRLPDYIVYYGKSSRVTHSATYKDQISFQSVGAIAHPIRNLTDTHTLFNFACANAIHTFIRVLSFYRPRELPQFGQMYMTEWRRPFLDIPRTKIQPVVNRHL